MVVKSALFVVLRAVSDTYYKRRGVVVASWLRWVVLLFCCVGLLSRTGTAHSVANAFNSLVWFAAFAVMTAVDAQLSSERAELQLAVIHGFPRKWIAALGPLALAHVVLRLLFPAVIVFGITALMVVQEWLPTLAVLAAVVGLGTSAVAIAGALSAVAWAATELAPNHPKKMFASLVLLPSLAHSALPQIPSVIDMSQWLIRVSITGAAA